MKTIIITNIIWVIISILVVVQSWILGLGNFQTPGVGFLPFYCSILMGGCSVISLIHTCKGTVVPLKEGLISMKVVIVLSVLFIYAVTITTIGFILGTFILLIIVFHVVSPRNWKLLFLGPMITVTVVYILFVVMLKTQLPKGILGF